MIIKTFEKYNEYSDSLKYISEKIKEGYVSGSEPFVWDMDYNIKLDNYTMNNIDYSLISAEVGEGKTTGDIILRVHQIIGDWKLNIN